MVAVIGRFCSVVSTILAGDPKPPLTSDMAVFYMMPDDSAVMYPSG
jgi:hypothetical protein